MNDRNDSLVKRAAALPAEIEPARDLWPGIASQLAPQTEHASVAKHNVWPAALAAGLALAVLSSSVTWWIANRPDVSTERIVAAMTDSMTPFAEDAEMLQVRQQLTVSLDESLNRLSPRTRRQVGLNLLEIHQSLADIRVALDEDPNNAFLHQLLHTTYQQELGLLSDINKLAGTLPEEIGI